MSDFGAHFPENKVEPWHAVFYADYLHEDLMDAYFAATRYGKYIVNCGFEKKYVIIFKENPEDGTAIVHSIPNSSGKGAGYYYRLIFDNNESTC